MKINKSIKVRYSPVFEEQLKKLREVIKEKDSKFHRQLLKAIEREKDNLLIDMHRGIQIPKDQIPKEYVDQYGVNNLWKINLPDYWRMIYTIVGTEFEIISILLEFIDYKEYDKKCHLSQGPRNGSIAWNTPQGTSRYVHGIYYKSADAPRPNGRGASRSFRLVADKGRQTPRIPTRDNLEMGKTRSLRREENNSHAIVQTSPSSPRAEAGDC